MISNIFPYGNKNILFLSLPSGYKVASQKATKVTGSTYSQLQFTLSVKLTTTRNIDFMDVDNDASLAPSGSKNILYKILFKAKIARP